MTDPSPLEHGQTSPLRKRRPGIVGALIIVVAVLGLWAFAACAELFWYQQHGSRIVIVALAAGPASAALLWIMTRRLRRSDALSPWLLVLVAILGGFVALIIPALVEPAWEFWTEATLRLPLLAPVIAGPLEEAVKLAAVVIVARWVTVRTARTGLFVGGAVGLGYAFFENIDFAWNATHSGFASTPAEHLQEMVRVALERGLVTGFAHPLWTAVAAAALFAGSRGGRLRISRLAVAGFAVAVVLHSLWDDIPRLIGRAIVTIPGLARPIGMEGTLVLTGLGWAVLMAAVGFVIWLVVAKRANRSAPPSGLTDADQPDPNGS